MICTESRLYIFTLFSYIKLDTVTVQYIELVQTWAYVTMLTRNYAEIWVYRIFHGSSFWFAPCYHK